MTEKEEYVQELMRGIPPKLAQLREKLREKAKREKKFRFYSLYSHLYREDVLYAAWRQVKANGGAAGEDGMSIGQIGRSKEGEKAFLETIRKELQQQTYRPGKVRRGYIEKPGGKLRPLGIPNVKDRVVQTALILLLEPIFEVDFEDCSYGFRPGRNAHQALDQIREALNRGKCSVYDADLQGYFDSIPHDKLMACVKMRVVDGAVLRLIRGWLKAPVVEPSKEGKPPRVKRNKQGTPQGGCISPLMANLYLHWFDKLFHRQDGPAHWAKAKLVRYADDFVVMARYISPQLKGYIESKIEGWLGLKINSEKTRVVNVLEPGQTLDFLGYSFRYDQDLYSRERKYWRQYPSEKSMARERGKLRGMTNARQSHSRLDELIGRINNHLRGWKNYYGRGQPRRELRQINSFIRARLARHLKRRSQRGWKRPEGKSAYAQLEEMGLIYL